MDLIHKCFIHLIIRRTFYLNDSGPVYAQLREQTMFLYFILNLASKSIAHLEPRLFRYILRCFKTFFGLNFTNSQNFSKRLDCLFVQ